ncbi:hypothetical protein QBC37DRAFT_398532 [Rhypophila decipiens]|uniref:Uncharacterized protein n=1 Tax=Rhypophila decipiens TaxID=261697 RepID=A0AAN6YBQ4_9PEZI|nr:hypothetical protein QBC37DRAFT_398532 [Rhypophila decipiens]
MGNMNCCPGTTGGQGSTFSSKSSYYSVPRNRDDYLAGHHRYSKRSAQELLQTAPDPTVRAGRNGRRPHAHFDDEHHYPGERASLSPLPAAFHANPPRLFGYAGNPGFDYATQNSKGKPQSNQAREAVGPEAGPIRLVADRDRNLVGVSYHPLDSERRFERATYHPRRSRHS